MKTCLNYVPSTSTEDCVAIQEISITYSQLSDCNSSQDQYLTITTQDNGAGLYYNISTEKWSIDSIEELKYIIEDFESRLNLNITDKENIKKYDVRQSI